MKFTVENTKSGSVLVCELLKRIFESIIGLPCRTRRKTWRERLEGGQMRCTAAAPLVLDCIIEEPNYLIGFADKPHQYWTAGPFNPYFYVFLPSCRALIMPETLAT